MKYILTTGWEDGIADLTERLAKELSNGKRVLWLTCGGSNIQASVKVMENLAADLTDKLSIMPADERFGPVGHANSNWYQMMQAGFDAKNAKLLPVLQESSNFAATVTYYQEMAEEAFADNDLIIAQLGIGEDGHVAGILPDTTAAGKNKLLACGYKHDPYTRLTLTFPALGQVNTVFAFAFGKLKYQALHDLRSKSLSLSQQPAQILKQLPEVYIYNDQVNETL